MTAMMCRGCGAEHDWDDIKDNTEPVEGATAKVVCPDCGNDKFDRMDS